MAIAEGEVPELAWGILMWVWLLGEIGIAIFTRTPGGEAKVQDRGTQLILWIMIVASLSIEGWMHAYLPADMPGHRWIHPAALAILVVGLSVRIVAIVTLGRSFSANVATRAPQTLQRRGLYRLVRHPSYLGMEIIFLAVGLHSRTWVCLAVAFFPPTIAILYRIQVEEIALRRAFGSDYDDYSRTTKRLIPGLY